MAALSELQVDLAEYCQNDAYMPRYTNWLNNAMVEIARDYELAPLKLIKPIYFFLYSDSWFYPMPNSIKGTKNSAQPWASGITYTAYTPFVEDFPHAEVPPAPQTQPIIGDLVYDSTTNMVYQCKVGHLSSGTFATELLAGQWRKLYTSNVTYHKKVTGARSYQNQWEVIPVSYEMAMIENLDSLHHDFDTFAEQIGVEDKFLGVYPRVDDVVSMYFYRQPVPMVNQNDIPDGLDDEFHHDVLIPWVIIRNFRIINQMAIRPLLQNLKYWEDTLRDGTEKMKLKFAKSKQLTKRGGPDPLP